MNELSQVNFHNASSIFATIDHNIAIVHAVLEGNSPGKIFVDTPHSPTIALLYAEDAFFYVVGDENSASTTEIVPLIFDHVLPQMKEQEVVLFSFSDSPAAQAGRVASCKRRDPDTSQDVQVQSEKIFASKFCSSRWVLLTRNGGSIHPRLEAIWRAPYGWRCAGQRVLVVFVGGGEAEIDIHTNEKYQRHGFATLTTSVFIEACLAKNLTPNWACWPERQASQMLANKLGFEELPDVPAHLWAVEM